MRGILASILGTRAVADGSFHVSQTPPGWIEQWGGTETASGTRVDETTSLQLTTVFACVRILAETVGSLPFLLYERRADGGRARATEHRLYGLLRDVPNTEMTAQTFRETLTGHVALWGNGYAEIEYNRAGEVLGMWPLRPDRMRVTRDGRDLVYEYRLSKADEQGRTEFKFPSWKVFHLVGWGFNGIVGYSPIAMARQAVGLGLGAEEYGARFFGNGARPGGVLEHPGSLGEEAHKRLRKSWAETHQGLSNAQRVAILEEGLSYKQIGVPPEEAQFLETRKFQVSEIARIYRVPPHMLADLDRATFSNIEHQSIEFVTYTMGPWFARWEQAVGRSLLSEAERARYFAEFLVTALLRGDVKSRYEAYAVGRQNGWLSANDIRRLENMNPIEGGDMYLVPLNMVPANSLGMFDASMEDEGRALTPNPSPGGRGEHEHGPPPEGEGRYIERMEARARRSVQTRHRLQGAYRRVYRDVAARVLRREANDVGNAARRYFGQRDYGSFVLWLNEFYGEHRTFVEQQFSPVATSYGEAVIPEAQGEIGEEEAGLTPALERWIERYVRDFADRHSTVSEARIREIAERALEANEDPYEAITAAMETWPEARAQETARWESVRFGNALAVAVFAFAGRTIRRWVTISDSCPYCRALDGRVVSAQEWFIPAGAEFQPEDAETPLISRTNVGHPPAHDGCDCMIAAG